MSSGRRGRQPSSSYSSSSGAEAGGGPQRFAGIEERQAGHVEGRRALRRLVVDNDDNRAAFHALAERDAATAGEPGVHETFEHLAQ